ncbi:hypothetical protein FE257_006954 [Aspergillus nanangensis]|uniref:SnoaL-like domain-containing protein n=1 Tax=Aspergillus nanangensis TaxID=2582783 RepID=A0AAD4CNM9_ASPNN|nr:hypothetical protein FE257_006954 [Aspergillus nanangensis]
MVNYVKTRNTAWPTNISCSIKDAIETFFQLLDGFSPEAAQEWSQLYHPKGKFEAFGQVFEGHAAIQQHILRFWTSFPGLNHIPQKIYTHGENGLDLIIITTYEITFSNGNHVSGESVAMMTFVNDNSKLLVNLNKLIIDPNPLMSGLAAASAEKVSASVQDESSKSLVTHTESVTNANDRV